MHAYTIFSHLRVFRFPVNAIKFVRFEASLFESCMRIFSILGSVCIASPYRKFVNITVFMQQKGFLKKEVNATNILCQLCRLSTSTQEEQESGIICCLSLVFSLRDNGSKMMIVTGNPFLWIFSVIITHAYGWLVTTYNERDCEDSNARRQLWRLCFCHPIFEIGLENLSI